MTREQIKSLFEINKTKQLQFQEIIIKMRYGKNTLKHCFRHFQVFEEDIIYRKLGKKKTILCFNVFFHTCTFFVLFFLIQCCSIHTIRRRFSKHMIT